MITFKLNSLLLASSLVFTASGTFAQDNSVDEWYNHQNSNGWYDMKTPEYFYGNFGITTKNPKRNLHITGVQPGYNVPNFPFLSDAAGIRIDYIKSNGQYNGMMPAKFADLQTPSLSDYSLYTSWDLLAKENRFSIDHVLGGESIERFTILDNGNVGLNISNPDADFQIYRDGFAHMKMQGYGTTFETMTVGGNGWGGPHSYQGDILMRTLGGGRNMIFSTGSDFETGSSHNESFIFSTNNKALMIIKDNGKVAIGTSNTPSTAGGKNISNYNLFVEGGILTEEVRVNSGWADYVFEDNYQLKSLNEVAAYINENGHLPNVPSAEQVQAEGFGVAEMTKIQQEKIEELTLYLIKQQEQIEQLMQEVKDLKTGADEE